MLRNAIGSLPAASGPLKKLLTLNYNAKSAVYYKAISSLPTHRNLSEKSCYYEETASTLIIGGGVVGTSIAYHMAKRGHKNVVLLEKTELTAGSTWHAAGLTTTFHPGINLKRLHYYSMCLYSQLEAETGQEIGLHQPGSIRITNDPHRVDEFRHQMSRMGAHQAPQCLLTPEQIKKKVPIIDENKVLAGLHTAYDGHVDPYSLTQALAKGAKKYGATVLLNSPVSSLHLNENGNWSVETPSGNITAERVVNAAGFWAREVSNMAGNPLPLCPIEHQYLITAPIPEVKALPHEIPVLRDMEGSCYVRMERGGLLAGVYEDVDIMHDRSDWMLNGVTKGFGKELYPSDLDRIASYIEITSEKVPCLGTAEIQTVVNGPITYSPDVIPLLGPDILPNMWIAAGFGYGIIHGGGAGKFISDWITNGECPFDLIECDPCRFRWASDEFVISKARESYGMNSAIAYPDEERFAGRPCATRQNPIYETQKERGGHMHFHSGWEQPAWFSKTNEKSAYKPKFERTNWHEPVLEECKMVLNSAGVIDLTPFGKLRVEGPDAMKLLDTVTANKLPSKGRTVLTHALTENGSVYAEFTMTQTEDNSFLLITGSASEWHDLRWLEEVARREKFDVKCSTVTDTYGCLSVAGPQSKNILSKLCSRFEDPFPFMSSSKISIGGVEMRAIRISYTGELGWEIYHPREHTALLYKAILDAGDEFGIGDFGTHALNVLRMEKGFRMWGSDMNVDRDVVSAGLLPFVKMDKGNFIGKLAVEKILRGTLSQKLVMAKIDKNSPYDPKGDETIWLCGKQVGLVTSGCFSNVLGQPLIFAYVESFLSAKGTQLEVELVGNMYNCEILESPPALPFNARKN